MIRNTLFSFRPGWACCCLLAAAVLSILTACTTDGPSERGAQAAPAGDHIFRLGILGPFSGPSESTGVEFRGAVTMAFEAINWQIGPYIIEPIWIDSQSDPEKAAQAYEQAIVEQHIQAAILNWHSSVAVSCMEVAATYQIPHIFPFGATEAVNELWQSDPAKYSYWMNKGWPVPAKLTHSYVQALESAITQGSWDPAHKTAAICGENTHWGRSFGAALRQQLEAAGWTIVAEEYFDLDQVQFYPLLNEFKTQDVALVAVTSTALPSYAAFINQADEVGLHSLLIADGLGWSGEWHSMTGEASNYVIDQIPAWATVKGQAFAEEFRARWGVMPSPSAAGLAYDGTGMFIRIAEQALAQYGELSSQTIYRWASDNLQTGRWAYTEGIVMPIYQYTPATMPDPVVGEGYYLFPVVQYMEGQGHIIYLQNWAEQYLMTAPK